MSDERPPETFTDTMRRLFGPPDEVTMGDDGTAHETWHQHPKHIAVAMINDDIKRNGTPWNKCPNCGEPYVIGGADWPTSNTTLCSESCEREYRDYLNGI